MPADSVLDTTLIICTGFYKQISWMGKAEYCRKRDEYHAERHYELACAEGLSSAHEVSFT